MSSSLSLFYVIMATRLAKSDLLEIIHNWVNQVLANVPQNRLPYFTAAGVKCQMAAVKRLPVLHHGADYISISIGIFEPILVTLKIEYHLSRC